MIGYIVYWNDDEEKEQSGIVISKYLGIIYNITYTDDYRCRTKVMGSGDYYIITPIEPHDKDIITIEHIECSRITRYVQPV